MKALSIIATSFLASTILITAADAMGRKEDPAFNNFMIKMADTNADGKISKDEWMKMSASMAAKEFAMMDMNDDGGISSQEFHSGQR